MKTPIQQLIDDWEDFSNKEANHLFTAIASTFINGAKEMLEKEKEFIKEIYWEGGQDVPQYSHSVDDWFDKTFNTTDK